MRHQDLAEKVTFLEAQRDELLQDLADLRASRDAEVALLRGRDEAAKAVVRWWDRTSVPVRDHLSVVLVAALDALAMAHAHEVHP
jgi:hypothetical protein